MVLVICPGMHSAHFTTEFLTGIGRSPKDSIVFPAERLPAYSPHHIYTLLHETLPQPEASEGLVFLAFSAGAVGAIGAARCWLRQGGGVKAFLAFDAWGVSLHETFPVYRFSHDYFTHWSSGLLGQGLRNFYADPAVSHLNLWRSPHHTFGYFTVPHPTPASEQPERCTAAAAVDMLLNQYQEGPRA